MFVVLAWIFNAFVFLSVKKEISLRE